MICSCTCSGVPATASLSSSNHHGSRAPNALCSTCGGSALIDRGEGLTRRSPRVVGRNFSVLIDPNLNWKTDTKSATKVRRGGRRARSEFSSGLQALTIKKGYKEGEEVNKQASNPSEDMPVSDSEKLGVTLLGQRFSASVPIKKRRISLVRSPSPPPQMHSPRALVPSFNPCIKDDSIRKEPRYGIIEEDIDYSFAPVSEGPPENVDFYGIAILAAAACSSSPVEEHSNSLEEGGEVCVLTPLAHEKACKDHDSSCCSFKENGVDLMVNETKESEGHKLLSSIDASLDKENDLGGKSDSSSSRGERFHWDLNTVMDAWETPLTVDAVMDDQSGQVTSCNQKLEGTGSWQVVCENRNEAECFSDRLAEKSANATGVDGSIACTIVASTVEKPLESKSGVNVQLEMVTKSKELLANQEIMDSSLSAKQSSFEMTYKSEELIANQEIMNSSLLTKQSSFLGTSDSLFFAKPSSQYMNMCPKLDSSHGTSVEQKNGNKGLVASENLALFSSDELLMEADSIVDKSNSVTDNGVSGGCDRRILSNPLSPVKAADSFPYQKTINCDAETCNSFPTSRGLKHVSDEENFIDHSERSEAASSHPIVTDEVSTHVLSNDGKIGGDFEISVPKGGDSRSGGDNCFKNGIGLEDSMGKAAEESDHLGSCAPISEVSLVCESLGMDTGLCVGKDSAVDGGGLWVSEHALLEDKEGKQSRLRVEDKDVKMVSTSLRSEPDDQVNSMAEVASGDGYDIEYELDGSLKDPTHDAATDEEQTDDDDSQFEDGEFREVGLEEDVVEEEEAEHLTYGHADNGEGDNFGAVVEEHLLASVKVDNNGCKVDDPQQINGAHQEVDQVFGKNEQENNDCCLQGSTIAGASDVLSSQERLVKPNHEALSKLVQASRDSQENVVIADHQVGMDANGPGSKETACSNKLSGRKRLPEGRANSEEAILDIGEGIGKRNLARRSFDEPGPPAGKALRRYGLTSAREFSLRIEKSRSSDVSHRKDRLHVLGSRSESYEDSQLRFESDVSRGKSVGRGGSSLMHGQAKASDHRLDSSDRWGPNRRCSPDGYGSPAFPHIGPKNAAEVAAAKVESSGFVVAPDGTLVKAGCSSSPRRISRRSVNSPSRGGRGRVSPTDREGAVGFDMELGFGSRREIHRDRMGLGRGQGRYGSKMIGSSHSVRYDRALGNGRIDSLLTLEHRHLGRRERERSLSPSQRRGSPYHLSRSRTKSPSRSRTPRSPHLWPSPPRATRGGRGIGFRRRSRSPNFRTEARIGRLKSPHRRTGVIDLVSSSSRGSDSPHHRSRWVGDLRELDHFREHQDIKSSLVNGRRAFIRGSRRYDEICIPGRLKADDYGRPLHSGRFPEFAGNGRGPRHAGSDEERKKHGETYGPSSRAYNLDGEMIRARYDMEDGFRPHGSSHPKIAEDLHRRGSPRDYDKGIDGRLVNGARRERSREEDGNPFRYCRDRRESVGFKSLGIQDVGDGVDSRRRPS
ncbi:hypothetical protein AMTRI_Chr09g36490 [Amborella trichopoda]